MNGVVTEIHGRDGAAAQDRLEHANILSIHTANFQAILIDPHDFPLQKLNKLDAYERHAGGVFTTAEYLEYLGVVCHVATRDYSVRDRQQFLGQRVLQKLEPAVANFSDEQFLAYVAYSGKCEYNCFNRITARVIDIVQRTDLVGLGTLSAAYSAGHYRDSCILDAIAHRAAPMLAELKDTRAVLPFQTQNAISDLLYSFANLHRNDQPMFDLGFTVLVGRPHSLPVSLLADTISAAAMSKHEFALRAMIDDLDAYVGNKSLHRRTVFAIWESTASTGLDHLLSACMKQEVRLMLERKASDKPDSSPLERAVAKVLTRMGVKFDLQHFCQGYWLDIHFRFGPHQIDLECDGHKGHVIEGPNGGMQPARIGLREAVIENECVIAHVNSDTSWEIADQACIDRLYESVRKAIANRVLHGS